MKFSCLHTLGYSELKLANLVSLAKQFCSTKNKKDKNDLVNQFCSANCLYKNSKVKKNKLFKKSVTVWLMSSFQ